MERNVSQSMQKRVAAEQQWRCNHCDQLLDMTYEVDHKIPLWQHGTNDRWNLQVPLIHILEQNKEYKIIFCLNIFN